MRQYATTDDMATLYPDTTPPANADTWLRVASSIADRLLTGVLYDVDPATGLPTDTAVAELLRDAVAAMVAEWCERGATVAGGTMQWESVAIGNVQLSNLQGASSSDAFLVDGLPIPPLAVSLLNSMGRAQVVTS